MLQIYRDDLSLQSHLVIIKDNERKLCPSHLVSRSSSGVIPEKSVGRYLPSFLLPARATMLKILMFYMFLIRITKTTVHVDQCFAVLAFNSDRGLLPGSDRQIDCKNLAVVTSVQQHSSRK